MVTNAQPDLNRELRASIANEQRLRRRLFTLEEAAVALRETRSPLLDSHADEMSDTRAQLNVAVRTSQRLRERGAR